MYYTYNYDSPIGKILLESDEINLTGLWFYGGKHFAELYAKEHSEKCTPVIAEAINWLEMYFKGKRPEPFVKFRMEGSKFQISVWNILLEIPYGKTVSYKDIALKLAKERGISDMSFQAVGNAVGRNKISVIIPCHRVIGTDGKLRGYAGGIDRKIALLNLESAENC